MDNDRVGGRAYVVSVMDNHSRCILACALTRTQDLASYLSVLYAAVERYGSPEALVTDGGGVFRARQARAVYEALGIAKHEIERGRPWQNYVETTFNVQRRMADWHFARAEGWPELELAHERFVEDYNAQSHFATATATAAAARRGRFWASPRGCAIARRSSRARSSRRASCGCATPWATHASCTGGCTARKHWREGRRRCGSPRRASRWSTRASRSPATTCASRRAPGSYAPSPDRGCSGRVRPQPRLFALDALGEAGWLKALKLEGYSPRSPRRPQSLQQGLFPYAEAL